MWGVTSLSNLGCGVKESSFEEVKFELSRKSRVVNMHRKHRKWWRWRRALVKAYCLSAFYRNHIRAHVVGTLGTRNTLLFVISLSFHMMSLTTFPGVQSERSWERPEKRVPVEGRGRQQSQGRLGAQRLCICQLHIITKGKMTSTGNSTEIGAGDVIWKSGYLIHFI